MANSAEKAGKRLLLLLSGFIHTLFQCPVCKADVTQPPHGLDPEHVSFPSQEINLMLHPTPTSNATERTPLLSPNNTSHENNP